MGAVRSLLLIAGALSGAAIAAPALDASERPAVVTRLAARSVLLGAAKAGDRLVAVGERGIVIWSDDTGATWHQAKVPVAVTLTAVRFADAQHGAAIGHSGTVLATQDSGQTWQRRLDGKQAASVVLEQAKASGDPAAIRDAQRLVEDGADKPFLDLHMFDAGRMLVVGAYNLVLFTDDGGTTWQSWSPRLNNPKALHWYAVRADGNTLVLAGEQGLVARSDDGGRSFRRLSTPYGGSFFSAEVSGSQNLLLAGMRGNVWRSGDGGASWLQLKTPTSGSITASALQRDGSVLLSTMSGELMSAPINASTPAATALKAGLPPVFSLLPVKSDQVLLLGGQGVTVLNTKATR